MSNAFSSSASGPHPLLVQTFRRVRRDARTDSTGATPTAVLAGINYVIDGGGGVLTTGTKGGIIVPFPCVIRKVELQEFDGIAGTITVDIKAAQTGPSPSFASICGSSKPTIATSGRYYADTSWAPTDGLTDWSTKIAAGTGLLYNVTAVTLIQRITVVLHVQRLDLSG